MKTPFNIMLRYFSWILAIIPSTSALFSCDPNQCSVFEVGDLSYTQGCNTAPCNFDSPVDCISNYQSCFEYSDCYSLCLSNPCDPSHLGNGICDSDCDTLSSGWDASDCGFCSNGCTVELLYDICDPEYENLACMYDNNACGWCADGCFLENLELNACVSASNVAVCEEYSSNPCFRDCSPGCFSLDLSIGYCVDACNTPECNYGSEYCLCSPGFAPIKLWGRGL